MFHVSFVFFLRVSCLRRCRNAIHLALICFLMCFLYATLGLRVYFALAQHIGLFLPGLYFIGFTNCFIGLSYDCWI